MIDIRVYECQFGILGLAIPDEDDMDCLWYRYFPQLPLWDISFMDKWDWGYDYYPWTCNYLKHIENETIAAIDGEDPTDPINYPEPTNIVEPSNVEVDAF